MSKSSNKGRFKQLMAWFSSEFKKGKGKRTKEPWRKKNLK